MADYIVDNPWNRTYRYTYAAYKVYRFSKAGIVVKIIKESIIPDSGKTINLHDGRILGFAEYGKRDGKPIFYFHGHPGCRFEAELLAEHAESLNVRIIGVDRPGLGLSTYKPGRKILDWTGDLLELAWEIGQRNSYFCWARKC